MVSFLAFSAALPLIAVVQGTWGFDGLFHILMACAAIILVGSRLLLSKPSYDDAGDVVQAQNSEVEARVPR
jgi:hypothetical protein